VTTAENFETKKSGNVTHHIFESVSDFVEIAKLGRKWVETGASEFTGHASFDDALKFVETGWADGHKEVVKGMSGMIEQRGYLEGDELNPGMSGSVVDVAAFIEGRPDCYLDFEEIEDSRPVLKVGVQFSAQGGYSSQCFTNRGSAMLSLVEILEASGIPVELWGYANTERLKNRDKKQRIDILLKSSSEPIDVDKIAFVLAHAAFYRQLGFGVKQWFSKEKGETFGDPKNCQSCELSDDAFDVVTPYSPSFLRDTVSITRWITETCKKLGLEVEV
jgi:hypothetical protein